ncbi:hypothetical protein [Burkholderia gladioli]|uniref:hypothetical protein n=1 Tax=Burkholderia gladioli TaxID=28095 RepID=UPI001640F783|nr:hypothetical protein [Burkholderia gladioli]
MRALRSGWMFRAGRRSRRLAGDGPRGDGVGKTGGGIRALAVARPGAATVAAPEVELRNACIALWMGVPRGATVATVRGRRPARRRLGETGSGLRALVVTKSAVEAVASAQPKSCLTLRGRIPLHCAARGRGKME